MKVTFKNGVAKVPEGIFTQNSTLIIPRLRKTMGRGIPAPYGAISKSIPSGILRGEDSISSVLKFGTNVTGALIQSENYNNGHVGTYWNDNNTQLQEDPLLRYNLSTTIRDLFIDGSALIRDYPWDYTPSHQPPDVHGPDYVPLADGIRIQGSGFKLKDLNLFQIPGCAIRVKAGLGNQGGAYGPHDGILNSISYINTFKSQYGMIIEAGDTKIHEVDINQNIKDGVTIEPSGAGSVLSRMHIEGGQRGLVANARFEGYALYNEASGIGTHFTNGASGSKILGLEIGPGTCWNRGVKISCNAIQILGLTGHVRNEDADHPDIAGVEFDHTWIHCRIQGNLQIDPQNVGGSTSKGVILRGGRNILDLTGGWDAAGNATFVKVPDHLDGCTVNITGTGEGGTILDLTGSGLNTDNGNGNVFNIHWYGSAGIKYHDGTLNYQLGAGNKIYFNGELLS